MMRAGVMRAGGGVDHPLDNGYALDANVEYRGDESNVLNFNHSATEYWINVRKSF